MPSAARDGAFCARDDGDLRAALVLSCLPHAEWFLFAYPFRVGDTLFPLFGLALFVRWRGWFRRERLQHLITIGGLAAPVVLSFVALQQDLDCRREWGGDAVRTAYAWVREHTPKDALVLCSAALDNANLYMQRPTVASVKGVPTDPADVVAWYGRFVELNGGRAPRGRGIAVVDELDAGFEAMPRDVRDALATKYGARYLLWPSGWAMPYEKLYDDGVWAVYRFAS